MATPPSRDKDKDKDQDKDKDKDDKDRTPSQPAARNLGAVRPRAATLLEQVILANAAIVVSKTAVSIFVICIESPGNHQGHEASRRLLVFKFFLREP